MIISVILPTRNRRDLAQNFIRSLYEKSYKPDQIELVLCIDDDDESYENFDLFFEKAMTIKSPRMGLGQITYNGICRSYGEIIFLCNDDVRVETEGWDEEFRKIHRSFPDQIYLMAPNDMNKSNTLFVFPTFSRKLFALLHEYPRQYKGAFIDTHLHEIFKSLKYKGYDRFAFLEHVRFVHTHFRVTGEKPDKTYLERNRFGDDKNFFCAVQQRIAETEAVLAEIIEGKEKKTFKDLTVNPLKAVYLYLFSGYLPFHTSAKILLYILARHLYKTIKIS